MNAIAIIPARGGSKGIPGKNLIDFCGKPLLAWSILQAKQSKSVRAIYVSSDDYRILDVAVGFGANPIWRPEELSTDTASSEQALLHALDEIESSAKHTTDIVVFLQATSPLREPEDIDGAVRRLLETESDSLFSMAILEDFCVWTRQGSNLKGLTFNPLNRGRRQDREPLYLENGSIYVFRSKILRKYNNRLGGKIAMFEMPFWKSYEIDKIEDIDICTYYFEKKLLNYWWGNKESIQSIQTIPAASIDLIVYDFDGVMTDNKVLTSQDGIEAVYVNRSDGLGINMIKKIGIPQIILSTESNRVVETRAKKVGLKVLYNVHDKKESLSNYCMQHNYDLSKVVFVGNDINDLEAMQAVGIPICPADAHPKVKRLAKMILQSRGGGGVIRELADYIIAT